MQPVKFLTLFILSSICLWNNRAQARSVLNNIPGVDLMSDLSRDFLDTVSELVNNGISSIGSELTVLNPHLEEAAECLDSACPQEKPLDPDAKRNVSEIIRSRGFLAEEYDVITADGYILTIQRIINPLVDGNYSKKPVILQHGLLSSSVDWVINSPDVRPEQFPRDTNRANTNNNDNNINSNSNRGRSGRSAAIPSAAVPSGGPGGQSEGHSLGNTIEGHQQMVSNDQEHPRSLGFYLANRGYDVFLANSRGNIYGQRHVNMSSWLPKFWDFTFDEQIAYDLPATIGFVQRLTKKTKVGYVGHSQGTTMVFGLLADQPEYADILEPVVALAPVAYVAHCLSPVKYFAAYTPIFQHINMWFGSSNVAVRYLAPKVCSPKIIRKEICSNIIFLSTGFDEAEFNDSRADAYLSHMPSGTSVKNIAHWGQEVLSGQFAHFDHGILANQVKYGQASPPAYDLTKIRSKSIALFTAENDWLAAPKDVAKLKAELTVPLFKTVNISESIPSWNHIDFVYGKDCGRLVNTEIVNIFEHFRD